MKKWAFYNEHDPFAAAWLRQLIEYGHIAPGIVDERSIEDIHPSELDEFCQVHAFAGIGVWSYALRAAGWSDDTPIWTGSCPCQPFSAAGKGAGFDDERHLWPAFHWLIGECRPPIVIGEQVASKDGLAWYDLVHSDLEISGYASAAVDMCAAGFGAPHIRQRLYWMAYAASGGSGSRLRDNQSTGQRRDIATDSSGLVGMDHTVGTGLEGFRSGHPTEIGRDGTVRPATEAGQSSGMADDDRAGPQQGQWYDKGTRHGHSVAAARSDDRPGAPGPTNGFWRNADWLYCRDERWRPVEPGSFPLVNGTPARMGRLRGYGNAIVAPQATAFIETVMEII